MGENPILDNQLDHLFRYLEILVKKPVNGPNNDTIYFVQLEIEKIFEKYHKIKFGK
jgi:hypothetical protein